MSITEKIKGETNQPVNFTASIITIIIASGNFIYSLTPLSQGEGFVIPSAPVNILPISLIMLLVVEIILGAGFGWVIAKLGAAGEGVPEKFVIVIGFLSAWTSLFNIQWLAVGSPIVKDRQVVSFIILSVFFCWLACSLIKYYAKEFMKNIEANSTAKVFTPINILMIWQVFGFAVMLIVISIT